MGHPSGAGASGGEVPPEDFYEEAEEPSISMEKFKNLFV